METAAANVDELLVELGYASGSIAVARNEAFIPKSSYADTLLSDNDDLEIVAPMQGG